MSEKIEKTVIDYGNIMALCVTEATSIMSTASIVDIELCRQITHDLFDAVTGESEKAAELDAIAKFKETAESFITGSDPFPLAKIFTPFHPGVPDFMTEDTESGEEAVPFEPENGEQAKG